MDCGTVSGLSIGDGAMDDGVLSVSESFVGSGGDGRTDLTGAGVDKCSDTGTRAG